MYYDGNNVEGFEGPITTPLILGGALLAGGAGGWWLGSQGPKETDTGKVIPGPAGQFTQQVGAGFGDAVRYLAIGTVVLAGGYLVWKKF